MMKIAFIIAMMMLVVMMGEAFNKTKKANKANYHYCPTLGLEYATIGKFESIL